MRCAASRAPINEMSIKKLLKIAAIALLAVSVSAAVVACEDGETPIYGGSSSSETTAVGSAESTESASIEAGEESSESSSTTASEDTSEETSESSSATETVEDEAIAINVTGAKTEFDKFDEFTLGNAVVTATLKDGSKRTLGADEYAVDSSLFDRNVAAEYKITVSFGGASTTYTVTVRDPYSDGGVWSSEIYL